MQTKFYELQSKENQKLYIELLEVTASLSNLFSESKDPFLYYRAMENIFCKAFNATNLSRSDVSADAGYKGIGIGLKTFLHKNGATMQKIAEFNKESYLFNSLKEKELILKVSEMRNKRILVTKKICNLHKMMYHLLTRSFCQLAIYEENMDLIDIDNIIITEIKSTTIYFTDKKNEYCFNKSKSTLLKRFLTPENKNITKIFVEILDDPFEFLLNKKEKSKVSTKKEEEKEEFIVLPLYSPKSGEVQKHSGLNLWNAGGRKRNDDEVYIIIPSWIHQKIKDFFPYNTDDFKTESFDVVFPNGIHVPMKVTQQGGKALMSDPNKILGKWILRDVLSIKPKTLVTKEDLDILGIDSIKLTKLSEKNYALDFLKIGSYETFAKTRNI